MSQILEANSSLPIDQLILDAADKSDLRRRQKRWAKASVFFKGPVYDELASQVLAALYVSDVIDEDGRVQAAIDWEDIVAQIVTILLNWFSGRFGSRR